MRKTPIWPMTNRFELSQCIALQLNGEIPSPLTTIRDTLNQAMLAYGLSGWKMTSDYPEIQSCADSSLLKDCHHTTLPLFVNTQLLGVVEWFSDSESRFSAAEGMLVTVTHCCAAVLYSSLHYAEAMLDPTTNILGRRFLEAYIEQRKEVGHSIVVASIDVDHLKAVNDTKGHDAGDALLKTVAHKLACCCRSKDFAIHLSGDEFALILRDIPEPKLKCVERCLKKRLEAVLVEIAPIRFSFGIAVGNAYELRGLLKKADRKMYRHKRQNQCAREVHYA